MTNNQSLIDLIKDMAIAHEMSHTEFCDKASWNETFQEKYEAVKKLFSSEIPAVDDLVEQVAIAIYQVTHEGKWENRSNERRNRYRLAATQIISDINSVNKPVSISQGEPTEAVTPPATSESPVVDDKALRCARNMGWQLLRLRYDETEQTQAVYAVDQIVTSYVEAATKPVSVSLEKATIAAANVRRKRHNLPAISSPDELLVSISWFELKAEIKEAFDAVGVKYVD